MVDEEIVGVVNEVPVPKELPPEASAYQLIVPAEAVAPRVTVPDPQREPGKVFVIVGLPILRSVPLLLPVKTGLLLTTRILYPVPEAVPIGIMPVIVPDDVWVKVPIATGEEKLPVASDN